MSSIAAPARRQVAVSRHRTIRVQKSTRRQRHRSGKILVNGGTDISKKPVWIEGPHIFKRNGRYYLIAAEGGTGYNHSEVVPRADSVWGPYVPYAGNPILTQRQLSPDRIDPVTCTGHADFVETPGGQWWGVFLGCRPYERNLYNTGRETFLLPVEWKDDWPIILRDGQAVPRPDRPDFAASPRRRLLPAHSHGRTTSTPIASISGGTSCGRRPRTGIAPINRREC